MARGNSKASAKPRIKPWRVLRLARRASVRRGLYGGSRRWMAVGTVLWLGRTARRAVARSEQRVAFGRLDGGQGLDIRTVAPPSRRERRAARRTGGVNGDADVDVHAS